MLSADDLAWLGAAFGVSVAALTTMKLTVSIVEAALVRYDRWVLRRRFRPVLLVPTAEEMARYGYPLPDTRRPNQEEVAEEKRGALQRLTVRDLARGIWLVVTFAGLYGIILGRLIAYGYASSP